MTGNAEDRAQDYADWIGRRAEARDFIGAGPLDRLSATLDRDDPSVAPGDPVPPLAHWLFFLPGAPQSALGPDGHPRRGGFLPPVDDLPRRMWAGSRLDFPGTLRVGMDVTRTSTIVSVARKAGRAGPLAFVTVRHEIGEPGGPALVVEEHDIVYRGLDPAAVTPAADAGPPGAWRRTVTPDPVMLFRYSALTFNGHRIHYDRDYVTKVEGYPGLVVHGPLIATLLVDLVRRNRPDATIRSFSFRALSPLFDGRAMTVNGGPPDADGRIDLWAANDRNGLAMQATARLDPA